MPTINLTCVEADEIFQTDNRGRTTAIHPEALNTMLRRVCFATGLPMNYTVVTLALPSGAVDEAEDYTADDGAVGINCGSVELQWPNRAPMTFVFVCIL